jgi:hypothetical protein
VKWQMAGSDPASVLSWVELYCAVMGLHDGPKLRPPRAHFQPSSEPYTATSRAASAEVIIA